MLVSLDYRLRNSLIERFDPRARWIFSLAALFAIVNFWDIRFLAFFFALSVFQYILTRLTWRETRRAWMLILLITFTMIFFNTIITSAGTIGSVMVGGRPIVQFPIRILGWESEFVLTIERLWFALAQVLRIMAIALLFMVIPFTMDPRIYGVTFRGLGLPDRLAFTLDLAFRFVPTLGRDFNITLDAQRARGYELERGKGGLIAQIRRIAPLLVPVTMNSILTGEDVANAMDLRCFGIGPRTWIQQLHYQRRDYALIAFGLFLLVGSFIARYAFKVGEFWVPF